MAGFETREEEEKKRWGEGAAVARLGFGRTPAFFVGFLVMSFSWGLFSFSFLSLFFSCILRSVFIVQESLRMRETKFQSNSFSSLKFEFD